MRKSRLLVLLLCSSMIISGCSLVIPSAPSRSQWDIPEAKTKHCDSSRIVPVGDVFGGLFIILLGAGKGLTNDDTGSGDAMAVIGLAWAASSLIGFRKVSACQEYQVYRMKKKVKSKKAKSRK